MAVTEASIDAALREMLPRMKATAVTVNIVAVTLADKFGVGVKELKAEWKRTIRDKVLELMHLCPDYEDPAEESAGGDEEDEEEEMPKPRRAHAAAKKRRNAISDESDAQDDGDSEAQRSGSGGDAESEVEDETPKKRRRISKTKERSTSKASTKKLTQPAKKATRQADPPGLTALKELGRAAGVLNPKVYKALKEAQSTDEAEEVVRDRLEEAGVRFSGRYPSARDISGAKKKRARDKELEDIDTSLIIDSGRPRRSAAQSVSYAPAPIPDADGMVVNGGGAAADEEEEAEFEEEEDDEDDADEDASASGSDESESEF